MGASRTGTPTIIRLARKICRIKGALGASNLEAQTSAGFAAAVAALEIACHAFEALDNYPAQIDRVSPDGPED